ncbi:malto-oligosyltrehalose synthase [Sphingobium bisphenolivorans]|uniref:malto-oligosyltrehalose synthase n=1 Tax=Sphingobium bisphenolivorans TaxID=1335760 RepID=UPI0003B5B89E|nr:malto-oligosyltrehalose synthase [Sphingobium bisphenolivorans]
MIPRATYRLQFHARFTFGDAIAILPYLDALGISHIYASPITKARRGSTHGYDVVDPTIINPELGGEAGFRALVAALRQRDMGIIIDIVPNHMGVAGGDNLWWNDVLRLGQESPHAAVFDIDWTGPIILPVLGATLGEVIAAGDLRLESDGHDLFLSLYGEQHLPARPGSGDPFGWSGSTFPASPEAEALRAFVDAQHYRLVHWRTANDRLNWRRFFSIDELAAVRVEDPPVFAATHGLYLDLFRQGLIDGVRIDHVDGLTDPAGYCRTLRNALDEIRGGEDRAYIVVEKILAADEQLSPAWGVDGTSGYDAMRDLTGLLHDAAGMNALHALWHEVDRSAPALDDAILKARQELLAWQFDAQLSACVDAGTKALAAALEDDPALEAITPAMLRRAMERLLWVFPVYRTYGTGSAAPHEDGAVRDRVWADVQRHLPPGEDHVAALVLDWLGGGGPGPRSLVAEVVRRFQQLSAPIAAKAVEDTLFYRHVPLLSANDVGFAPDQPAVSFRTFHERTAARQELFPHAMLASATHDHKRGEDARARLALLSDIPDLWAERWQRWGRLAEAQDAAVHPADRYQIVQGLFGAWPLDSGDLDEAGLIARLGEWIVKMLREAKLRSAWEQPDEAYEERCRAMLGALLAEGEFRRDFEAFLAVTAPALRVNILAQTALKYMMPGIPDLYQGAELPDFSLVDPDNRRPVDFSLRRRFLAAGGATSVEAEKLRLIADLLAHRRAEPELFAHGDYVPVSVEGDRADHVLAFTRNWKGERLLCAVMLHMAPVLIRQDSALPPRQWWGETVLLLDQPRLVADLFDDLPVHISRGKC